MSKKPSNKANTLGVLLLIGLAVLLLNLSSEKDEIRGEASSDAAANIQEKRDVASTQEAKPVAKNVKEPTPVPTLISSYVPTRAPASLGGRWSQVIRSEDDSYVSSQLNLDSKPIENYFYRWKKDSSGQASELVAGVLPEIKSVQGAFPSPEQSERLANDVVSNEGEVMSLKEVWNLNSERVLNPQLKVEVQVKDRTQRSAGHEYWFISVNSGQIVKRLEADRY